MRRRAFVRGVLALSGAAALPARAQQGAAPVIGLLSSRTASEGRYLVAAIQDGLKEMGYIEGRNVAIEYRWAEGRTGRLPALAAELVRRPVAVIIAGGTSQAAKAATSSIPIVFTTGLDPVAYGLVANLNQPRGNLTGATFYSGALAAKHIELLRELVPKAATLALLVKQDSPSTAPQVQEAQRAARAIGREIHIVRASDERDLEPAFAALARGPSPALIVAVEPFFDSRPEELVALAARYGVATIYSLREFVRVGGLMSYGASITETYRQAGIYAGRILKGAKPAELPVLLPTKFELVINLKTAKAMGLKVPRVLLLRADEVIE